ncbi:MAG: ABC transporter ATP-binding protein [Anaerolineales bacterium]|nr:MAG: ABC transporter ATP-binding protein [Anaerolineales bacterium]
MPRRSGLGRAVRYLGHYRKYALFAYLSLFISTSAILMVPRLTRNIIDAITSGFVARQLSAVPAQFLPMALDGLGWTMEQFERYQNGAVQAMLSAGAWILAFAIVRALFAYVNSYMSEQLSQSVAFDLRNDLFARIQRLSFSYHDRNQTGQLMVRATDDVEKLRLFIGQGLLMAVQALFMLTVTLVIVATTNWQLTLVMLPLLPVALILFMVFGAVVRPLFTEVQVRLSRLNTILQENLAGIKVIKAFVREAEQERRFNQAADDLMSQLIRVSRIFSFLFPVVFLVVSLGQAGIQYFGGRQIIEGTLSLGQWQEFSLYLMYVFMPLGQLGMIVNQMSQASASAQRIFEILDTKNEVEDKPDAQPLPPIQGQVEFDEVTFRYFAGGEAALQDVSFTVEPGQTVALLGATGSGKSTIINLIPRFYDGSSGAVRIDGHDVRDVRLDSLRGQIGIVLQDTTLFTGTIRDNVAFGRPDAGMEEIIAAAKAAAAHDFIMSFPDAYDTPVGERGKTLSGGQKQRIAIARALLMDPRILILDDSTSSVDFTTEYEIQQALSQLMVGRTSFVIAQRISTVRNADIILVLEKGRIAAQGKHGELLENSPIYAEIYHSQLVEDAPSKVQVGATLATDSEV